MLLLDQATGKDGVILRHGDTVIIDTNVIGPKESASGKIERIESAGSVELVYLWHRGQDGRVRVTPFNARHLEKP